MIVKNESHIIQKTLENILKYIPITYWVISDTGSTDNTITIIKDFFKNKNIPGELFQNEWIDFGHNRTLALEYAYKKTDYLLIFDADDSFNGNFTLPNPLNKSAYFLKFGKEFTYKRILLINNHIKWKFIGVLHEYITQTENNNFTQETIEGNYFIESGKTGNRNNDPQKYKKDAKILSIAYEKETNISLKSRYAFYCAQSYKDANLPEDAIIWYKKCLHNNWSQEKYYSSLEIGNLYSKLNHPFNAINFWIQSAQYDHQRIEGIVNACELFYKQGNHLMVNLLYEKFKNYNKNQSNKLFVNMQKYNDELEYYNSISSFYINEHNSAFECCKKILINQSINKEKLHQTISNILFYKQHYNNDEIFQASNKYLINNTHINPKIFQVWNNAFNPEIYTKYNKINPPDNKTINIILTITSCKRLNLFQKTINSITNTWLDIHKIDYWFCIDDNSSKNDREFMQNNYPWINFHFKSTKGHRDSMNIIWDKLNEIKPKYWIHIEDDFLFFIKQNYIEKSIHLLEQSEEHNIHQILFNRNYAETIEDYQILGHKDITDELCVHQQLDGRFNYKNCHYWPHFSFRPGIIRTEKILELGNFNSPNTFFEKDYAIKWQNAGYKTGFFNQICCKHIGKLTSENIPNAYTLNNQSQFNTTPKIKIINLKKRPDRKEKTIKEMEKLNIEYEFIEAIDGCDLELTSEIRNLFLGNDFGNRKAIIGCALTHFNLWKQLLESPEEYFIIFEDDIKITEDANIIKNIQLQKYEFLFLGYHMFEKNRKNNYNKYHTGTNKIELLDKNLYIGGFFSYSINKNGAKKLIDYINNNGIKHGIDYLIKIMDNIECYELQPQIIFSEWNENNKLIDTNIQTNYEKFNFFENFTFIKQYDQIGYDMDYKNTNLENMFEIATNNNCIGFNTFGYFKNKIKDLTNPTYFNNNDGIYIKKSYLQKLNRLKKVKMICNWTSSENLCKEWSNMCKEGLSWNYIEMTWEDDADYYCIINKPLSDEYYEPEKTIVFQMEPWVSNPELNWGVKTWREWAIPDEKKFLAVRGRKTHHHNNAFWQLELNYNQLKNLKYSKQDRLSSITSSKYFDEGHIARINFLKFLEEKNDIPLDIYNWDNKHNFKNYRKGLDFYVNKSDGYVSYKYYFMVENNYEDNFITEKLWEPILCETLIFYYGCPNVKDYIDENAYVQLDMNDFEKSYEIIKRAIEEDWWSKRINVIRKEKEKIMEKLAFFPTIETIIQKNLI